MTTFRETMSDDHRQCDVLFAAVETAVSQQAWAVADGAFLKYERAMLAHFKAEEDLLFPAFENRTGMRMGPTQVMRNEHAQMCELIGASRAALEARDAEDYSGYAETLLIMMQQHNMKEENVLYPMCDQQLGDAQASLLPDIGKVLHG